MSNEILSKDQRVLVMMRKVLTRVVRETTPQPGMRHPLSGDTIEDIRQCLALIAARERELAEETGLSTDARPRYPDQPQTTKVVPLHTIRKPKKGDDS